MVTAGANETTGGATDRSGGKSPSTYSRALAALWEDTREWWGEQLTGSRPITTRTRNPTEDGLNFGNRRILLNIPHFSIG
jgi:hypothetical protein